MWRQGGSSVRRWGFDVAGAAVLGLGAGIIVGALCSTLIGGEAGAVLGTVAIWAGMIAASVFAFSRGIPRELFRFRAVDILYGVAIGGFLRVVQGWLATAAGHGGWPSYPSVDGALPPLWWGDLLTASIIAPVIEEVFFRGVVLVAMYTIFRRYFVESRAVAGIAAGIVSTALFVIAHALLSPLTWDTVVSLALVGLVNSALVLLTGRIWGAVAVHVVFNFTLVLLTIVGTLAA